MNLFNIYMPSFIIDGKYIRPFSCVPSEELNDKNNKKVDDVYRELEPNIPGEETYGINGNKLKEAYKKKKKIHQGE